MRPAVVITSLLLSCSLAFTAQTPTSPPSGSAVPGVPLPQGRGAVSSAPATGTAVIRGSVVAAESGQALRGVRIDAWTAALERPGDGRRGTTTDERGRFELAGLPEGRYTVTASKGGYHPLSFGQRRPSDAIQAIDLADGEVFDDASFVLSQVSVISGRVVDVHGDPLLGVTVGAERYRYVNGHRILNRPFGGHDHTRWESRTDDRGEFRLFGLPPGGYVVSASVVPEQLSAPSADEGYARTYYPGTMLAARAQPIVLGLGEARSGVVIRLMPSRMATISGMAVDVHGRPYASAQVDLREASRTTGDIGPAPNVFGLIDVAADGSFSISRVAPGEYYLDVRTLPLANNETGRLPLVVTGNDLTGLVVRGQQGFQGRGRIVGPDGRPPDGLPAGSVAVEFQTFPPDVDSRWTSRRAAPDWTFEALSLRGQQAIRAVVSGQARDWAVRRITHQGQNVTDGTLDFSRGPVDDIVIELTRTITSLGGSVRDFRGGVPRDAVVVVFADDPARWRPPSRFIHTARPDPDGTFFVHALPPGHYVAVAVESLEPGQEMFAATLEALRHAAASSRISLSEGETRRVDLRLWDGF